MSEQLGCYCRMTLMKIPTPAEVLKQGTLLLGRLNCEGAEACFAEAVSIQNEVRAKHRIPFRIRALIGKGTAIVLAGTDGWSDKAGRIREARDCFREAKRLAEESDDPNWEDACRRGLDLADRLYGPEETAENEPSAVLGATA